jgi:hypothetical protein
MLVRYLAVPFEDRLFLMRYEGFIGFVYTNADHELYWQIDEHGNPYDVELARMPSSDICDVGFSALIQTPDSCEPEEETKTEIDMCKLWDLPDDIEWFTPMWEEVSDED